MTIIAKDTSMLAVVAILWAFACCCMGSAHNHAAFINHYGNNHQHATSWHHVDLFQPSSSNRDRHSALDYNHLTVRQREGIINIQPITFSTTTSLQVKSLRDLMDDGSPPPPPSINNNFDNPIPPNNNGPINMNHGPDIKTMRIAEIKRELLLYGIIIDATVFVEKRDLEEALLRERMVRIPTSSQQQVEAPSNNMPLSTENGYPSSDETKQPSSKADRAKLRELQIAFEFERVQSSLPEPSDIQSELESRFNISTKYFLGTTEMAYALAVSRVDAAIERQKLGLTSDGCVVGEADGMPISWNKNDNSAENGVGCVVEEDLLPTPEELIAMEYENLQPWDLNSLSEELENQYGIPAKHFMGKKEMAYALAVERVDLAMREGAGFIVDDYEEEDYQSAVMTDDDMMRMMEAEMMKEENEEKSRSRESQQRQPQSSFEVSSFGGSFGSSVQDQSSFGGGSTTNSFDDPSSRESQQQRQSQSSIGDSSFEVSSFGGSYGGTPSVRDQSSFGSINSVRDTPPSKKTFKNQGPNPFGKKEPPYQSTPLADMLKNDKKNRGPPKRTPLSSEQHSFQRQQQRQSMGSVIGGPMDNNINNNKPKETKSLTDILKGSEQKGRSRATTPPHRTKVQERAPRSSNSSSRYDQRNPNPNTRPSRSNMPPMTKTTYDVPDFFDESSSSRFDEGFQQSNDRRGNNNVGDAGRGYNNAGNGYNASWNKQGGPNVAPRNSVNSGGNGYATSWNKQGPTPRSPFNKGPQQPRASTQPSRNGNKSGSTYTSSWNKQGPTVRVGPTARSGSQASSSSREPKRVPPQRPFEPAPFTAPGTHNAAQSASSSSSREPKRVPPSQPFQSPVTGQNAARRSSQGPFTPFTTPGKRSTNGTPPPTSQKRRPTGDPRGFNIKDTPDTTQSFVGSQVYVDQNTPYSPPLQVEPPPRDPNYVPPERPFEPAPFSGPQGQNNHRPRDKWDRVGNSNSNNYAPPKRPPPMNNNNAANDRQYQQQQKQTSQSKRHRKKDSSSSSSPFDNLKDMFSNMGGGKKEKAEVAKEDEPRGFKSGNVEVFSSNDDGEWPPSNNGRSRQQEDILQQAVEVEIIDAETMDGATWQEEEDGDEYGNSPSQQSSPSSDETFSNAWKGGSDPASSATYETSNGATSDNANNNSGIRNEEAMIQKAHQLLASNPEIRAIVAKAQSNPRVREAVQECMGNPAAFAGWYLEDPVVGPVLKELKECILLL